MFTIVLRKVFLHIPRVAVRTVMTNQLFNVSFPGCSFSSWPALCFPCSTLAMTSICLGPKISLSGSSALFNRLSQQQMNASYTKISHTNGVN